MSINYTPIGRLMMGWRANRYSSWEGREEEVQQAQLMRLLRKAKDTEIGRGGRFSEILAKDSKDARSLFAAYSESLSAQEYEGFREYVLRMTDGERDVLWPGVCTNFAQSSGTSGGRSKYVPVTIDSLRFNHYPGAADTVASYLKYNPESRIFGGKGFILGGSFSSNLKPGNPRAKVGDLSATLIDKISPLANLFRVPSKQTALLSDWEIKLERLSQEASYENITNLSGVPSWFLRVLQRVLEIRGKEKIHEVWPNLEVFFHGGISFEPYREEYAAICDRERMHYFETYNASEGFFGVQADLKPGKRPLRLLLDVGVYYEFMPLGSDRPTGITELEKGKVYELVMSSCNGLWRYRLGDTIKIESLSPLLFTLAGRTKSFINAFGEELMENNAEQAIAEAARKTGSAVRNYTAAPVYSRGGKRGRHQWLIEWETPPVSEDEFSRALDEALQNVNSDYAAKRSHTIFLDPPQITTVADGTFDRWLHLKGNGKLGGQRKVPRLSNNRQIVEEIVGML